jgi:hypothetical protein
MPSFNLHKIDQLTIIGKSERPHPTRPRHTVHAFAVQAHLTDKSFYMKMNNYMPIAATEIKPDILD